MTAGIYRIVARREGKPELFYIGQAIDLDRRERDHFRHLRSGRHDNPRLQAVFDKYGEAIFVFERILICSGDTLANYEQNILDFYVDTVGRHLLNICQKCVTSSAGVRRSADTRARMSAAKKGKPGRLWSIESRLKVSSTKKGIPPSAATIKAGIEARTGSSASTITRARMSASHLGRVDSAETRAKKSAARKNLSNEGRVNLSIALRGNKNGQGSRRSPESRLKISIAALAREKAKRESRSNAQS
jgi:group I intron endonuclease